MVKTKHLPHCLTIKINLMKPTQDLRVKVEELMELINQQNQQIQDNQKLIELLKVDLGL
jgi:hypothetical protein